MIKRLISIIVAAFLPGLLLAGPYTRGVTIPFGSVSVFVVSPLNEPETISSFEHRFYNMGSDRKYGRLYIVPSAGPLHIQQGSSLEQPGFFSARTVDPAINIQITATSRGSMHRYTFFQEQGEPLKEGKILLDLDGSKEDPGSELLWTEIRVVDQCTVTGCCIQDGEWDMGHMFFAVRFSRPVRRFYAVDRKDIPENYPLLRGKDLSAVFEFDLVKGETQYVDDGVIEVQIAFSSVDALGALNNLKAEQDGRSFETLRWDAGQEWEKEMAVITIDEPMGNKLLEKRRALFYRALYATLLHPSLSHDVDGRFRGNDNNIHASVHHVNYTSFFPAGPTGYSLMTLLKPERSRQFVASMLAYYDRNVLKLLPGGDAQYLVVALLTDAHAKGILPSSLTPRLLDALNHTVTSAYEPVVPVLNKLGFVPASHADFSISLTRKLSYEYWCLARMAGSSGDFNMINQIRPMVTLYQWLLDPKTGYARQRNSDLSWHDDPDSLMHRDDLLFIPHNMADVVERTGGRKIFEKRLDSAGCFDELPYLYLWTGAPWKGQQLIREMMDAYDLKNESPAWFVFSAMGLYPLCPGTDQYVLGVPYFKKMTIQLENGNVLIIEASRLTDRNIYVKEVKWNGKVLDTAFITHQQIMLGGALEFIMTSGPVRGRTFRKEKLPYSYLKK
ncbi:MAG: glycoside hydrolase domain-containing protein [Bacteroidales bacterium]|jgi:putative alpha-1,2-mannosidase|nr:glycoside hydrolase family 92 protein [Bacteroidales bacterium]MDD2263838.1 glycoside hydrolase family 92 protein [Bacteroidales bacterium]MDD2830944.1 glycoside hydrolase family 92 protein [Bacteroidales bacterium]MDD3208248.1 glycoside hydrolase family 92 protein [Bacteroidales bacterium]MDD3696710.1 glycoside hydrolase family 92 protein [Bacteroidales bacterium]